MKFKKVAWLLTVIMLAGSVGNSALIAQGAELSAAEKTQQDADKTIRTQDASGEIDSNVAESAQKIEYKQFTSIPEDAQNQQTVYAFTAPKDGTYQVFLNDVSRNVQVYDSDFTLCAGEDESAFICKAGETYYLVCNCYYVGEAAQIAVYPTLASFEMKKMPKMEYVLRDSYVSLDADETVVECTYSNGETEEFSEKDDHTSIYFTAKTEDDDAASMIESPGSYPASIEIAYRTDDFICTMYHLDHVGDVKVLKFSEFLSQDATQVSLDQTETVTMSENKLYTFMFTAPEDGIYTWNSSIKTENGIEISGIEISYYDTDGNKCKTPVELKTGEHVFAVLDNEYGDYFSYSIRIRPEKKAYTLKELQVVSEPTDKDYVEKLDYRSIYNVISPKTDGLKVKAVYSDGTEEVLGAEDLSRDKELLQFNVKIENGYDPDTAEDVDTASMDVSLGAQTVNIPLNYISLTDYIQSLNSQSVETVEPDVDKTIQFNGSKGVLCRFTPSQDATYIMKAVSETDTYGYLLDEKGEELASDDDSGHGSDFKISYKLEAGKTYYYLARPYNYATCKATLQLSQKEEIKSAEIQAPDKTTFIAKLETPSYQGMKVKLNFVSGKSVEYQYGEDGFYENISISDNYKYDDDYKILPGEYELTLESDGEKLGTVPIKVQSLDDYASENEIKELKAGKDIAETYKSGDTKIYKFVPEKTGEYRFFNRYQRTSYWQDQTAVSIYDSDVKCILNQDLYGTRTQLEAGKIYYIVVSGEIDELREYTTSVLACRTLQGISLEGSGLDLGLGIHSNLAQELHNQLYNLPVTLKFTDDTEETIHWGESTQDGYSLSWSWPGIDDENAGEYQATVSCGDFQKQYDIHVYSTKDFLAKKSEVLEAGKRTPLTLQADALQIYSVTIPEDGYYKMECLGKETPDIQYYDEDGNKLQEPLQLQQGEKIYTLLKNNSKNAIKSLLTMEKQKLVLTRLTVKSKPTNTRMVENIDYINGNCRVEDYIAGLVVTAEYSDGTTQDLSYNEEDPFGNRLDAEFSWKDGNCFMIPSLGSLQADPIQMQAISFSEYLKNYGEELNILEGNTNQTISISSGKYQVYRFVPEKDDTYTFYSKGSADTYGIIFDENGDWQCDDDDSGNRLNFRMQYQMKKGKTYYVGIRAYTGSSTTIRISDSSDKGNDTDVTLSDFEIASQPEQTEFPTSVNHDNLETWGLPYDGLKIRAKKSDGTTAVYTYSEDEEKFPFTLKANVEWEEDDSSKLRPGKYPVEVQYNGEKVAEFTIELKTLKDYLADVTTELQPEETVTATNLIPTVAKTYCIVKLPSNLKGRYVSVSNSWDYRLRKIYDSDGNETDMQFGTDAEWDFAGKNYYLCLEQSDSVVAERDKFRYEKIPAREQLSNLEIVSQPEVQEYLLGMKTSLDLTGMSAKLVYQDGSEKTVSVSRYYDFYNGSMYLENEEGKVVTTITDLNLGTNKLNLVFGGKKQSFTLTVKNPAEEKADVLEPGKTTVYSATESRSYHVYSYTPKKDGSYDLDAAQANLHSGMSGTSGSWYYTDAEGTYLGENSRITLKGGETYYFVVWNPDCELGDVSVKLTEVSGQSQEDLGQVYQIVLTAPDKTVFRPDEEISYDGMKITAVYESGLEKEYTVEEAEAAGFTISNNVEKLHQIGQNFPGDYKITVSYQNSDDYSVKAETPIKVQKTDAEKLQLIDQSVKVTSDQEYALYSFEVPKNGYYQLKADTESGNDVRMTMNGRDYTDCSSTKEKTGTQYSDLIYLKKGEHAIYISEDNGTKEDGFSCELKLISYASAPESIEQVKDADKTTFTLGEDVTAAGAQFEITYRNGEKKLVTIPENYRSGDRLETGLYLEGWSWTPGERNIWIHIDDCDGRNLASGYMSYTVFKGENLEKLENKKTYTFTKQQLKTASALYDVKGSEQGDTICTISGINADVQILTEDGNSVDSCTVSGASDAEREIYFVALKNKTYRIVVGIDEEKSSQDPKITFTQSKAIQKITALPEDAAIYVRGENEYSTDDLKVQLTYADGSTSIMRGSDKNGRLLELELPNIISAGTYSGKLFLGSLYTSYSRTVLAASETMIQAEEAKSLSGNHGYQRFKFVPDKTQYYYALGQNDAQGMRMYVEAENGDNLGYFYSNDSDLSQKMLLTAGKTYYFDVRSNEDGTFLITDGTAAAIVFKNDQKTYKYTGEAVKPKLFVSYQGNILTEGKDYQMTLKNNTEAGTASVEVKSLSAEYPFETQTLNFTIAPCSLEDHNAVIEPIADRSYTGSAQTPEVKVTLDGKTLRKDLDYTVFYKDNVKPGKAEVTVTGIGNYSGTITGSFQIKGKLVNKISLNRTSATVTAGSSLQLRASITPNDAYDPAVKWTSSNPAAASVSASGKVTVSSGAAGGTTVKITATSADGSKVSAICTIKINNRITYNLNGGKQDSKNKTTFCKQSVKLYSPSRSGYRFAGWYTDKSLKKKITSISSKTVKNVTIYAKWTKVTKSKAPTGVKLKNSAKKSMTVSYKAVSGVNGYEITYAANRKLSKAKKVLTKTAKATIKGLKKGSTYYVRVRAYKTDSTGAKIYGINSKIVNVKIKK